MMIREKMSEGPSIRFGFGRENVLDALSCVVLFWLRFVYASVVTVNFEKVWQ